MVRKWVRRLVVGSAIVTSLLLLLLGVVYANTSSRLSRHYEVTPEALPIPSDPAAIERGRHVLLSQAKCGDCHGADLSGGVMMDDPGVGTLTAPNITPAGVTARYSDADWVRAIRHGLDPHGRPLVVMPSYEYARLGKQDVADMVAYLRSVPPVAPRQLPETTIGPVGRGLMFAGMLGLSAEQVDHAAPIPVSPPPGPTAVYGEYMVRSGCGCHGDHLSGGKLPGTPPDWLPAANLTPSGPLAQWSEADFFRAMREGKRPDGSEVRLPMPIAATKLLTDDELRALWLHLKSVPPRETGTF